MKETRSAGGVVLNRLGEVLVVNQKGRSWSLPKGHIEFGEEPLAAAKREIYEEAGVNELVLVKELGVYERFKLALDGGDDRSEKKVIAMFLFTTPQLELKPLDPDNPEARWVKKEAVAALLTHPKDKKFFLGVVSQL